MQIVRFFFLFDDYYLNKNNFNCQVETGFVSGLNLYYIYDFFCSCCCGYFILQRKVVAIFFSVAHQYFFYTDIF